MPLVADIFLVPLTVQLGVSFIHFATVAYEEMLDGLVIVGAPLLSVLISLLYHERAYLILEVSLRFVRQGTPRGSRSS